MSRPHVIHIIFLDIYVCHVLILLHQLFLLACKCLILAVHFYIIFSDTIGFYIHWIHDGCEIHRMLHLIMYEFTFMLYSPIFEA